jgi:hypothetical protein
MMNAKMSWLLAALMALTLSAATAAADPEDDDTPFARPTKPSTPGVLTEKSLRTLLDNMGYEPKSLGGGWYEITLEREGGWTLYLTLRVSPDQKEVFLTAKLSPLDPRKAPADRLLKLLRENDYINPAAFVYNDSQKFLYLVQRLPNRDLTAKVLRSRIDNFGDILQRTASLWDTSKWQGAEVVVPETPDGDGDSSRDGR